jgi:hypothetical protein
MQITLVGQKKKFFFFFLLPVKIQVDSYRLYIAESKCNNQIALSATYNKENEYNSELCL